MVNKLFRRLGGYAVGIAAQAAFLVTVAGLYWFMAIPRTAPPLTSRSLIWDVALALGYAVPHSVLRLPRVQGRLARHTGREFYGAAYCLWTCGSLWAVFLGWAPGGPELWRCDGVVRSMVTGAFHLAWPALGCSMWLSGFGYQTGFTEWNCWRRGEPVPRRKFTPRGLYRWIRHPIYLSFALILWLTPVMTADRLVLAMVWTAYIAVGSFLKDERLAHYSGDDYRRYQERVPGYPLMPAGPLGRRPDRRRGSIRRDDSPATRAA